MPFGTPSRVALAHRISCRGAARASTVLAWGRRLVGAAVAVAGLAACEDQRATAPRPALQRVSAAVAARGDSLALVPLARGLAAALADPGLRRQVVEDLRDSPFPEHGIHAASYLAGPRGHSLLDVMARAVAQQPVQLLASVAAVPNLQLVLPVRWDRVTWTGDSTVVAVASARTKAEFLQLGRTVAYTAAGDTVPVVMDRPVGHPVVALLRADQPFSADPDGDRGRAPKRQRRTASTHAETYGAVPDPDPAPVMPARAQPNGFRGRAGIGMGPTTGGAPRPAGGEATPTGWSDYCAPDDQSCICYYDPYSSACDRSTPVPPEGLQTPTRWDHWSCRGQDISYNPPRYLGPDTDGDGLVQGCEAELAYAFRPYMSLYRGSEVDITEREEYWAAYPAEDGANQIQLFYAFSYYFDLGDPQFGSGPHPGDSEFVVIRVRYVGGTIYNGYWQVASAFFAAHWNTMADASQNVSWDHIEYRGIRRGRSLVYVARDKHGSYNTLLACDRGGYGTDTCDGNTLAVGDPQYEAEVLEWANLGNPAFTYYNTGRYYPGTALIDCISSRKRYSYRQECFWSGADFRGWQENAYQGATGYDLPLKYYLYRGAASTLQ